MKVAVIPDAAMIVVPLIEKKRSRIYITDKFLKI